ncbi:hypothetical protein TWF694_003303 [Orbilia ellipsospora]|uniref:Extracellular membrane protein CFEM domain-containing protein n=1 Tax=Orbilia ellipsospora TaxID=2528407 RepID=A0AAV9X1H3_9PEZI
MLLLPGFALSALLLNSLQFTTASVAEPLVLQSNQQLPLEAYKCSGGDCKAQPPPCADAGATSAIAPTIVCDVSAPICTHDRNGDPKCSGTLDDWLASVAASYDDLGPTKTNAEKGVSTHVAKHWWKRQTQAPLRTEHITRTLTSYVPDGTAASDPVTAISTLLHKRNPVVIIVIVVIILLGTAQEARTVVSGSTVTESLTAVSTILVTKTVTGTGSSGGTSYSTNYSTITESSSKASSVSSIYTSISSPRSPSSPSPTPTPTPSPTPLHRRDTNGGNSLLPEIELAGLVLSICMGLLLMG